MTTTRTVRSTGRGPVHLRADTGSITLTVITEARPGGEITVSTNDDDGPSADAVCEADLGIRGQDMGVRLRATGTTVQFGDGATVQVNSGRGVFIAGDNYGAVTGGVAVVNGRVMSAAGSPITVVARLPHGSTVDAATTAGSVACHGVYDTVRATTMSGGVTVGTARQVQASTQSGSVHVGTLTGRGDLSSMSGSVRVSGPNTAYAKASSMSGNVTASGGMAVDGSSMSGRVRTR